MVVFFQPTFHEYFLEHAQGRNPNLAYSFSDVIEFTCLGFCLPHLPTGGWHRSAAQLSLSISIISRLRFQVPSPGNQEGLSSSSALSIWGNVSRPFPLSVPLTNSPLHCSAPPAPSFSPIKINSISWGVDHLRNILYEGSGARKYEERCRILD